MEKLGEVLARVAEQLGVQAAALWPKVVLYHWIVSLFWAVTLPALSVTAVWTFLRCYRKTRAVSWDFEKAVPCPFWTVAWGPAGLVLAFVMLVEYPKILASVFSPEAGVVYKALGKR